jgi:hypothetical protein
MKLIEHEYHSEMYYIEWDDGIRSQHFYNRTRATELIRRLKKGIPISMVKIGYTTRD